MKDIKTMLLAKTTIIEIVMLTVFFFTFTFLPFILLLAGLYAYHYYKDSQRKQVVGVKETKMTGAFYNTSGDLFTFCNQIRVPRIGTNEVLVKVYSASINPVDFKFVTSKIPFMRWFYDHHGIANDFSGKIVEVGSNVTQFKEGDDVFGFAKDGSLQQYTRCDPASIAKKPSNVSFNQAASIILAGETSYQALTWFFPIEGKSVLVIGASGGTGHLAIQIAKYLKAATVYGVCSSSKADYVSKLGADKVIEYNKEDYLKDFEDKKFDLIYDTVTSPDDANQEPIYRPYLKSDGRYVAINSQSKFNFFKGIITSQVIKTEGLEPKDFHLHLLVHNQKDTEFLGKMASEGKLTSAIDVKQFEKSDIAAGFEALHSRRIKGKIVYELIQE